jgi:hypothetical protein
MKVSADKLPPLGHHRWQITLGPAQQSGRRSQVDAKE